MKYAATRLRNYIITAILLIVAAGVSFGQYYIVLYNFPTAKPWNYMFILLAFGVAYLLFGYVAGDIKVTKYRHKSKKWNDKLPQDLKNKAWMWRYAPFLSGAVLLIFSLALEIISLCTGVNPPF